MKEFICCVALITAFGILSCQGGERIDLCSSPDGKIALHGINNTKSAVVYRHWTLFQKCATKPTALVLRLQKMELVKLYSYLSDKHCIAFLGLSALLSYQNICQFKEGTCIVIQSSRNTCPEVSPKVKNCKNTIWVLDESALPLSITYHDSRFQSYYRYSSYQKRNFLIHYSYTECSEPTEGPREKKSYNGDRVAAIVLGLLFGIMAVLSIALLIRFYRHDIQIWMERRDDRNASLTFNNEDGTDNASGQDADVAQTPPGRGDKQPGTYEKQVVVNELYGQI